MGLIKGVGRKLNGFQLCVKKKHWGGNADSVGGVRSKDGRTGRIFEGTRRSPGNAGKEGNLLGKETLIKRREPEIFWVGVFGVVLGKEFWAFRLVPSKKVSRKF